MYNLLVKIIKGSKEQTFTAQEFEGLSSKFAYSVLDIGTGDGRFVYKMAKENHEKLFVGMDPSQKQLEIYSKKINKEKLENVLLVLGSVEIPPQELIGKFDEIYINFPWGSLLGGIATANTKIVETICKFCKPYSQIEIIFGYSDEAEPTEYERLQLEKIDQELIANKIVPEFSKFGFKLEHLEELRKEVLVKIGSSWAKKLKFGQDRKMFRLALVR